MAEATADLRKSMEMSVDLGDFGSRKDREYLNQWL